MASQYTGACAGGAVPVLGSDLGAVVSACRHAKIRTSNRYWEVIPFFFINDSYVDLMERSFSPAKSGRDDS